jgi:hypothetical protein
MAGAMGRCAGAGQVTPGRIAWTVSSSTVVLEQPVNPGAATYSESFSPGGYTRNPSAGVGPHVALS